MGNKRRITAKKGAPSKKSTKKRSKSTDFLNSDGAADNITRILDSSAEELAARLERQRDEARWREEDRQDAAHRKEADARERLKTENNNRALLQYVP